MDGLINLETALQVVTNSLSSYQCSLIQTVKWLNWIKLMIRGSVQFNSSYFLCEMSMNTLNSLWYLCCFHFSVDVFVTLLFLFYFIMLDLLWENTFYYSFLIVVYLSFLSVEGHFHLCVLSVAFQIRCSMCYLPAREFDQRKSGNDWPG